MEEELGTESDVFANVRNVEMDLSSDAFIEDSFSSVGPATSTPLPNRRRETSKKVYSGTRLPCTKCTKTYMNERTLFIHMKTHFMEAASKRAPDVNELGDAMTSLLKEAILVVMKCPPDSDIIRNLNLYCSYLCEILEEEEHRNSLKGLCDFLACHFASMLTERALFPSAIKAAVQMGTNKLLTNAVFRQETKAKLLLFKDVEGPVLTLFLGELMFVVCEKVLVFALAKINESVMEDARKKRCSDAFDSDTFKQLVHYIGGAVIKGILWKGERFKNSSPIWCLFVSVIKKNFVQKESGDKACVEEIKSFTSAVDRGGLTFISEDAFLFFSSLFELIISLEGVDGSLPKTIIDEYILVNDHVICLWYGLTEGELSQEQSLELLVQMCECGVRVVAKGILKRRLNEHLQKTFSSVSLRSRLAR